jgi:hypothetical protein
VVHYYHKILRFSRRYFWFFVAWKIVSFFLFTYVLIPWLFGKAALHNVAYVAVVTTPDYSERMLEFASILSDRFMFLLTTAACVAAYSLFKTGTPHPVVALVPKEYEASLRPQLSRIFNEVIAIDSIANPNKGAGLARPEYVRRKRDL